jgi:Zn-dependent peptidase ImmA (M78 family)/transcriptional regulator with XRE-family HTH domain
MKSGVLEAQVVPGVLRWARETMGKTFDEVAKRVNLGRSTVEAWETGRKRPTLKQLKELAVFYKRPLAAFFLPSPPQEVPLPADFRSLPSDSKKPFTERTLLALRRARRLQDLSRELAEGLGEAPLVKIGKVPLPDDSQALADQIRRNLDIPVEKQLGWKTESEALNEWKRAVESYGALVLELSFPIEEGRAFCLSDPAFPAVVLNSTDSITGRIFSLFHELCHLLLAQSGICDMTEQGKPVEHFSNRFAGELLVPGVALLAHPIVNNHIGQEWQDDDLQLLGRHFKVSKEVILRRLLISERTSQDFYARKRVEWESQSKEKKPKGRRGRRIPARQCLRQNGIPFTVRVLESAHKEMITYRDVSDYLSVGLKHLPAVETLVSKEMARSA